MERRVERRRQDPHLTTDQARAGSTPRIVRYVLLISLALAIGAMTVVWVSAALLNN